MDNQKILAFFRLIRFGNLVFIALTQYLIRWFVIMPVLNRSGFDPILSEGLYALLVLSTVLIAAAGYIINDYFDVEIDRINKPDKVIVTNIFSYNFAMRLQMAFNITGILIGTFLSWQIGNYRLGMMFVLIAAFLWFYSLNLKRMFFVGNVVVSICIAMVVILPGLFEVIPLVDKSFIYQNVGGNIMYNISGYAIFAFFANLIREVVKDIEDMEGDLSNYASTMPIVIGATAAKVVVAVFLLILIGMLVFVQNLYYQQNLMGPVVYVGVLLQLPSLLAGGLLFAADTRKAYGRISMLLKIIMLFGMLSMVAFQYLSKL